MKFVCMFRIRMETRLLKSHGEYTHASGITDNDQTTLVRYNIKISCLIHWLITTVYAVSMVANLLNGDCRKSGYDVFSWYEQCPNENLSRESLCVILSLNVNYTYCNNCTHTTLFIGTKMWFYLRNFVVRVHIIVNLISLVFSINILVFKWWWKIGSDVLWLEKWKEK